MDSDELRTAFDLTTNYSLCNYSVQNTIRNYLPTSTNNGYLSSPFHQPIRHAFQWHSRRANALLSASPSCRVKVRRKPWTSRHRTSSIRKHSGLFSLLRCTGEGIDNSQILPIAGDSLWAPQFPSMTLIPLQTKPATWQYAVEKHLSCLSGTQRARFVAPANADECLELIRQAQGRKKYERFMVALRPLIEPLKRFEGSIDVLVQAQSCIASPVWGPLRMVVTVCTPASYIPSKWPSSDWQQLISDRLKTLQNLVVLLDRMVDPLKRFANYEFLFSENELLQHAIAALYCDLLDFCSRIIRFYSRSSFCSCNSVFACWQPVLTIDRSDRLQLL
jgi:hypothetical protein